MGQHGFVLGHMVVREVDLNGRIPRLCVLGETEVSRFSARDADEMVFFTPS